LPGTPVRFLAAVPYPWMPENAGRKKRSSCPAFYIAVKRIKREKHDEYQEILAEPLRERKNV